MWALLVHSVTRFYLEISPEIGSILIGLGVCVGLSWNIKMVFLLDLSQKAENSTWITGDLRDGAEAPSEHGDNTCT